MSSKKFFLSATAFLAFTSIILGAEKVTALDIVCPTPYQASHICPPGSLAHTHGHSIDNTPHTWGCGFPFHKKVSSDDKSVTVRAATGMYPHGACLYTEGSKPIGYLIPTYKVTPKSCTANNTGTPSIHCQ